jgi:hypothetical protein
VTLAWLPGQWSIWKYALDDEGPCSQSTKRYLSITNTRHYLLMTLSTHWKSSTHIVFTRAVSLYAPDESRSGVDHPGTRRTGEDLQKLFLISPPIRAPHRS